MMITGKPVEPFSRFLLDALYFFLVATRRACELGDP